MALLIAAEEDVQQSRQSLRRRARKICPSKGPTQEEEQELKILSKSNVRKMYELDDFKRDFDTKPFVATEMVDLSFERIVDNIRRRQQALQNLRREIYEDSVLRVAGYYRKATEQKNADVATEVVKSSLTAKSKRASKTDVEKSNYQPKITLVKSTLTSETNMGKSSHVSQTVTVGKSHHTPSSTSESDMEGDESYAAVQERYRAEKLRLEKNLEIFKKQLQEFIDSRTSSTEVHEVAVKSKKRRHTGAKKSETKTAKTKAKVKTIKVAKSDAKIAKAKVVKAAESDSKMIKSEAKADKARVKTVKGAKSDANMAKVDVGAAKLVKIAKSDVITVKTAEPDLITVKTADLDVKDDEQKRESQVVDGGWTKRKPFRLSMAEIQAYVDSCDPERAGKRRRKKRKKGGNRSSVTELPLREEDSDIIIMDKVQGLGVLPKLNPMPVYTDNFQASCVLTHLFSSRDNFDEDFEEDYIIPTYESEQKF
ncbi:translation initiation factor IF-2-like [Pecten maximus]|uniref:translation initiation factor IF-2-like n=1 Tax=Pecten maximus TaxID=6579 RepID=UPI0014585EDF|nr:translation initiation factor IF-2-like [Pecten maximus]